MALGYLEATNRTFLGDYRVFNVRTGFTPNEKSFESLQISLERLMKEDLKLKGLEGEWSDKEFEVQGISEIDVFSSSTYKVKDKVYVSWEKDANDYNLFMIHDYDRTGWIFWLALVFAVFALVVGRWKGFTSLISLVLTFLIIMKYIVPKILDGSNPLMIALIGSFAILVLVNTYSLYASYHT